MMASANGKKVPFPFVSLVSTDHVHVLGGQDVVDTSLAVELVLQTSTGSFGGFFGNVGLGQAASTLTTGVFGKVAQLRELRLGGIVEQLAVRWHDLPFQAKVAKVVNLRVAVTSKSLASLKVTGNTDGIAEGLFGGTNDLDSDKLLESLDLDLLTREGAVKIDGVLVVARADGDWEATNGLERSTVLIIDVVVALLLSVLLGCRSLDFQNVIADTNGNGFDVAPVSDHLGTKVDIEVNTLVPKVLNLCHDKVALAMELKVFVLPGAN